MTCKLQIAATIFVALLTSPAIAGDNELSEQEKEAGWQLLFNGQDLTGWKCNNGKPIATSIEKGSLVTVGTRIAAFSPNLTD